MRKTGENYGQVFLCQGETSRRILLSANAAKVGGHAQAPAKQQHRHMKLLSNPRVGVLQQAILAREV